MIYADTRVSGTIKALPSDAVYFSSAVGRCVSSTIVDHGPWHMCIAAVCCDPVEAPALFTVNQRFLLFAKASADQVEICGRKPALRAASVACCLSSAYTIDHPFIARSRSRTITDALKPVFLLSTSKCSGRIIWMASILNW